jgi:hypothetical protein
MTTPQLQRLLLPKSLASAGWDIVKSRRDLEGILLDDEEPPESLHPVLREVDGVVLGHTHLGQAEVDAAPRATPGRCAGSASSTACSARTTGTMFMTPIYTQCNDFDLCFGEESSESRMAECRREFLLHAGSLPPQNLLGR